MAEMAAATGAENLGTGHAEAAVAKFGDVFLRVGLEEAGPAGARIELRPGGEEREATSGAEVDSLFVVIEEVAAKGWFGSLGPEDAVGRGAELFLPFGVGFDNAGR